MSPFSPEENLKKYSRTATCPVRNVLARISGKWAILILSILAENGATRFGTLRKAIPDISPKMLAETLKNLETDGLIARKVYAEVPPKVEYSLTGLGRSLMPHLTGLIAWAVENYEPITSRRRQLSAI